MTTFTIRIDHARPAFHTKFTVFANGANCGHLTMRHAEGVEFFRKLYEGGFDFSDPAASTIDLHQEQERDARNPRALP